MIYTGNLRVGWIGLGSMGLAMATNIQRHIKLDGVYPALKYWNRTLERGKPLEELGATACPTIADLAQSCDVIFISVSDDDALKSVINSIQESGDIANKFIVDTTTIHPSTSNFISASLASTQARYLAAPVFGATPVAQAGLLLVAMAGPPAAISIVSSFIKGVIARQVLTVGSTPSQALLLKTTSNFITAGLMTLLSEAHVLAETAGLPSSTVESLIEHNFGTYALGVSQRLTSGAYLPPVGQDPSSRLELGIKDVGHGVEVAREHGMRLGIGEMYIEAAEEARKYGEEKGRKCDSSAVYGVVRQRAGLEFESEAVKERDAKLGEGKGV